MPWVLVRSVGVCQRPRHFFMSNAIIIVEKLKIFDKNQSSFWVFLWLS
jgi:hypothetical protein